MGKGIPRNFESNRKKSARSSTSMLNPQVKNEQMKYMLDDSYLLVYVWN